MRSAPPLPNISPSDISLTSVVCIAINTLSLLLRFYFHVKVPMSYLIYLFYVRLFFFLFTNCIFHGCSIDTSQFQRSSIFWYWCISCMLLLLYHLKGWIIFKITTPSSFHSIQNDCVSVNNASFALYGCTFRK